MSGTVISRKRIAGLEELSWRGLDPAPGRVAIERLGVTLAEATEYRLRILSRKTKAWSRLLWTYRDPDEAPSPGDRWVLLGIGGRPAIVTRLRAVQIVPYIKVDAFFAAREGIGDGTLTHWRRARWPVFSAGCARLRREPGSRMPIVCADFEIDEVVDH